MKAGNECLLHTPLLGARLTTMTFVVQAGGVPGKKSFNTGFLPEIFFVLPPPTSCLRLDIGSSLCYESFVHE